MDERKYAQNEAMPSSDEPSKQKMIQKQAKPKGLTVEQQEWKKDFDQEQTITAGVEDLVHEVLYRIFDEFEDIEGPRMTIFLKVWQETSFVLIFHGRESFRELYEFTEELFDIVKQYALKTRKKDDNPEGIRFAALYLLYALYFKQPCRPKVKIRLTFEEFDELVDFIEETKDCYHYDVVYAWAKLFSEAAFHYVATPGQLGLELAFQLEQKEIKAKERDQRKGGNSDFFSSRQFQIQMQKVKRSHKLYQTMKKGLVEENPENFYFFPGPDSDCPAKLLEIVEGKQSSAKNDKDDIGEMRKKIKNRFFSSGNVESHRDHLFAEGRKKANSQSEDDQGLQLEDMEQYDDMKQDDNVVKVDLVDDRVPFMGKPRSQLRGKSKRRGGRKIRGKPRSLFTSSLENAEIGLDGLEINSKDVEGNLVGNQVGIEWGKHGRKHKIKEKGRGIGRGEGGNDQNYNLENMEDNQNNEMTIPQGISAGPSGVSFKGKGRGRGGKMNRRVVTDSFVEEQGGASGQVGEKMENAKVKRKNKKGMWGNVASQNLNQEEQLEQEPVFKFQNTE